MIDGLLAAQAIYFSKNLTNSKAGIDEGEMRLCFIAEAGYLGQV